MKNIVYIKKVDDYNDILKKNYNKISMFLKKIIYLYKNIFGIITKKKIEDFNIWVLPVQEKFSQNKINKIIKKLAKESENIYLFSNDCSSKLIYNQMDMYNLKYLNGKEIKKYLLIKILNYINNIQGNNLEDIDITLLINDATKLDVHLIEKLAQITKNIKIISKNFHQFKKLEESLNNKYGIALQFSNSYRKSLAKERIIINLNFNPIDINEYDIYNRAIIINRLEDNIKIKSKLYNGIVINSCDIKLNKEIREKFKKANLYNKYSNLLLYASTINDEEDNIKIFEEINKDKIMVVNLIGNNGIINKKEIKNISKSLTKK